MKLREREAARALRREGQAVKVIARQLGVAPSSVSLWVRDIELTAEQKARLLERNPRLQGSNRLATRSRERRRSYQEQGRAKAREGDPLHLAGCMLYWAEGAKKRNTVKFSNSDPALVKFFLRFLRECYSVPIDRIAVCINCFTDSGLTLEEIERFWQAFLEVPPACLRKSIVNQYSKYTQKKRKGKLKYGVCALVVCSTELAQSIFGAIQEYAGFSQPAWLD